MDDNTARKGRQIVHSSLKLYSFAIICFALLSACSRDSNQPLSGYIEGEYTYISSSIPGTLFTLNTRRGQIVSANQLLFTLDPEPEKSALLAAKANISELAADVTFAKVQMERQQALYHTKNTEKATLDQATSHYQSKLEHLNSLKAAFSQAQWSLQQKTIYSPVSGFVFDTYYRLGEKVAANQPVLSILRPENIKVLFYIPEKRLSSIHLGQKIQFTCDGCKTPTTAVIHYISPEAEYTPPIIYSADTRYKLVYLIRADLPLEKALTFHPGQPIDVRLHE